MKSPTTLYRYNLNRLTDGEIEKYKVQTGDTFTKLERDCQTLYRVRKDNFDFYGFRSLKEARNEYFSAIKIEIHRLTEIIKNNKVT